MGELQEITELFSSLALQLRTPNSSSTIDERSLDLSISDLNRKLNPNAEATSSSPGARVLDTALSLMCFKAPQVFDLRVEYLVKTIVSVLSSSVECKALSVQNRQILLAGSSISRFDCFKLLETLDDLIEKLEDRGIVSFNLLHASIRAMALTGYYQHTLTQVPTLSLKSWAGLRPVVSRLIRYVPDEILHGDEGIELRLMLWYLDPFLLKIDVSKVLQEVKDRPFLCVSDEFKQRNSWNSLVKCLVLCPAMLTETRTLLHNWFVMTGSSSVLKLQVHFLTTLLDVLSRPTFWGMSMDIGSRLPFLHAYFPCNIHLLRVLTGPLSLGNFSSLAQIVETKVPYGKIDVEKGRKQLLNVANVHHHSMWGTAIIFKNWFLFGASLLFCDKSLAHNYHPEVTLRRALCKEMLHFESPSSFAASYIAWILCPVNYSEQVNLKDFLVKVSGSLTKQFIPETLGKQSEDHKKKFKRLKRQANVRSTTPQLNIGKWLEEFHDSFTNPVSAGYQNCYLIRSIPLGVLLVFPNYMNEDECDLLLHYGATGRIISNYMNEDESNSKEAIDGACFVFDLTDAVESLSASLFDTEEESQGFIHLIKERTEKYLLKCITILLRVHGQLQMLKDLQSRIVKWRYQGEDSPLESQDLDEAIISLKEKVTCLQ